MKKEYIALAVIIVALLLYIFFKDTNRTQYTLPEVAAIDTAKITSLSFSRSGAETALERNDEQWIIQPQGYPADPQQVERMLKVIGEFAVTTLVSEAKSYSQYDLTDDQKIVLKVFSGDELLLTLDMGKTAATHQHTFVRLVDDHRVYQARGNMRQPFDVDLDRLRDKVVARVDKDLVTGLSINSAGEDILLHKRQESPVPDITGGDSLQADPGPVWRTAGGEAADEAAVTRMLSALTNLRCDSYIEGRAKEDFSKPFLSLAIEGGNPLTLEIFEKQSDNKFPAVSSQCDYPFLLPEYLVNQLNKKPADILSEVEATAAP